ncbi:MULTISPECIES: hypothetical protein [unclassified Streptomyces]
MLGTTRLEGTDGALPRVQDLATVLATRIQQVEQGEKADAAPSAN